MKKIALSLFIWTAVCFKNVPDLVTFLNSLTHDEAHSAKIIQADQRYPEYPYFPANWIVFYDKA